MRTIVEYALLPLAVVVVLVMAAVSLLAAVLVYCLERKDKRE